MAPKSMNGFTIKRVSAKPREWERVRKSPIGRGEHNGKHMFEEGESSHFHFTITFEDLDSKTRLTMRSLFPTTKARDKTVESGAIEGGKQTLGRLAQFLKEHAARDFKSV